MTRTTRPRHAHRAGPRLLLYLPGIILSLGLTVAIVLIVIRLVGSGEEVVSAPRTADTAPNPDAEPDPEPDSAAELAAKILAQLHKSEPVPERRVPQPDPEVERLKREMERLKVEARRREVEAAKRQAEENLRVAAKDTVKEVEAVKAETARPAAAVAAMQPVELRDLFEKAAICRAARDPGKLLGVLRKLKTLRPEDPLTYFGLGEVYSSAGAHLSLGRARSSFQKFLDLTTDESFGVNAPKKAIYTKIGLAASLRKLSGLDEGDDIQKIRLMVRHYLELLEKKQRFLLVTPRGLMAKMESKALKELDTRKKTIKKAEAGVSRCERRIKTIRHSRPELRAAGISAEKRQMRYLRQKIAREENKVGLLTAELARLRKANS